MYPAIVILNSLSYRLMQNVVDRAMEENKKKDTVCSPVTSYDEILSVNNAIMNKSYEPAMRVMRSLISVEFGEGTDYYKKTNNCLFYLTTDIQQNMGTVLDLWEIAQESNATVLLYTLYPNSQKKLRCAADRSYPNCVQQVIDTHLFIGRHHEGTFEVPGFTEVKIPYIHSGFFPDGENGECSMEQAVFGSMVSIFSTLQQMNKRRRDEALVHQLSKTLP